MLNNVNRYLLFLLSAIYCAPVFWLLHSRNQTIHHTPSMQPTAVSTHSYSNFRDVSIKHLHLDLFVDFSGKSLNGFVVLDILNVKKSPFIVLDYKNLVIEKVEVDGKHTSDFLTGNEDPIFGTFLKIPIDESTNKVKIHYHTLPESQALQWLAPHQTTGKEHPLLFTQSQAILARTWIPLMDIPAVRFTYSARIRVPQGLMAVMSASNPQQLDPNGVYEFQMDQPIPSYLMALCVGNIVFKSLDDRCGVYAEPEMIEKSYNEFTDLPKMVKSAEALYGPYRWGRYDVLVLPPSFPFGGMENPKITFATPTIIAGDKSLVSLIAHELAHSWSGNLVTNANWNDFWLNEGFTVYFEQRIMEAIYGRDYAEMLAEIALGELKNTVRELLEKHPDDTHLRLNLEGRDPDEGVSDIAYEKGRFFLRRIESLVGREKFDPFIKSWFEKHAFGTATTDDFIQYLEKELIKGDEKLSNAIQYKEWIDQPGLPKSCEEVKSTELDKVRTDLKKYAENKDVKAISAENYTTHHWLYFLRNLPQLSAKEMAELDNRFYFVMSANSEISCDWYILALKNEYEEIFPAVKKFLHDVGRRKFLMPLYRTMVENPKYIKMAKETFESAKEGYHAVSSKSIEILLSKY